jgi:diaminopimelate decarboxylase
LETIQKAAEKQPTPFHIYDEVAMRANAKDLTTSFQKHFPDFKNYFAVKATPNPHILRILKEEGMGTDCSSLAELILSEKVGMKGEDIMFTSNDTPSYEYKKALELGAILNIDDISHIEYLEKNFGSLPNLMCLRYNPGPLKEGNTIIGEPQQAKFGLTRSQVKQAYVLMKERNVSRFGLHCMVASNELKPEYFRETAKLLFDLVVEVSNELNIKIEFVNMAFCKRREVALESLIVPNNIESISHSWLK